ncbi:MAG TPA: hypothetical protein VML75_23555 [Kofleriaceae bacterium]|nr:hypothetical protein [Kofleriaceae bacterium]
MGRLLIITMLAALAACGGNGSGSGADAEPVTFDGELARFIESICQAGAQCFADPLQDCRDDVTADMMDARAALDAAGEAQCAACMRAKSDLSDALVAADCDTDAVDPNDILPYCDLDPNVDYLGDGNPDDDEACAGYP